ncbi:MAG: hypothetical protein ACFHWX_18870 [Bacteroidota bacterium]
MKKLVLMILAIIWVLLPDSQLLGQDLLVTSAGDSIECEILNISADTVHLKTMVQRKVVSTVYSMGKVSDIKIGFYQQFDSDTTAYYQIETADGNLYMGQILSQEGNIIQVRTLNIGDISLRTEDIEKMKRVDAEIAKSDGSRWFDYLQSSRYFYAPSGYGLKKGDAYYQNVWILFNQFSIGFTDEFSAGIGMVPLFLFAGAPTPVWVTPKLSLPIVENKFNLGVGGLFGGVIGLGDYSSDGLGFGILYGIATVGERDKNFSLGIGYGYADGDFAEKPAVSLSGMLPIGKRNFFITENYLIDNVALLSVGGRSLIKKVTLDYGIFMPTDGGTFLAIPWLGIVIPIETNLK